MLQRALFLALFFSSLLSAQEPTSLEQTVGSPLELVPQVVIFTPTSLVLTGHGYDAHYGDGLTGIPAFHIGTAINSFTVGDFAFAFLGKVGYGTKETSLTLRPASGADRPTQGRLHWFPLAVAARATYQIPGIDFFRPSLSVSTGAQYFYQTTRAGFEKGYWVPFLQLTPALSFLEENRERDWFGGFTFGTSYQTDLASPQQVRAWTFEMSVSLFL